MHIVPGHPCAISVYPNGALSCSYCKSHFLTYISTPLNFPGCPHDDTGYYIVYANERNQLVVLSFDITH